MSKEIEAWLAEASRAIERYIEQELIYFDRYYRPDKDHAFPKPFPEYKREQEWDEQVRYTFFKGDSGYSALSIIARYPIAPQVSLMVGLYDDANNNAMAVCPLIPGLLSVFIHYVQARGFEPLIPYPQED